MSLLPSPAAIAHNASPRSSPPSDTREDAAQGPGYGVAAGVLCVLWLLLFFGSLFAPPVLDDADGTHANAARQMALSGDLVTMRVNGVRYLEKAPLPYWIAAASIRAFGVNVFAVHLPQAVAVLLLALLGLRWGTEAFGRRAGFYAGLGVLTSAGVFLFTRVFIPDVLLSLLLAGCLYCLERALVGEREAAASAYAMWVLLALAVLTKGLVAIVFLAGTAALYLALTGKLGRWRRLRPLGGAALFLAIAAPWHLLAGVRNAGDPGGHGFFWFYFINEHVMRFLGRRVPRDYNKLPGPLYWGLHLVWLFPWSVFAGAAWRPVRTALRRRGSGDRADRTILLLTLYAGLVLAFFSLSTNQEYYTFPAYLPLLMLLASGLARAEEERTAARALTVGHAALTAVGVAIAAALAYGLWSARGLPAAANVGDLLAHRGVGDYTLSMSSLFDLTGPSFAALRLPAVLALAAFLVGPALAWRLRTSRRHLAANCTVATTAAVFLVAAHIALVRFAPMLSSKNFADRIRALEASHQIASGSRLLLYGDQAYGSSIPYYLNLPLDRPARLVDGRSSSMLFGSTFADSAGLFLTPQEMLAEWGRGPRKLLFVPLERRDDADRMLNGRAVLLDESSGKALLTDRPVGDGAGAR